MVVGLHSIIPVSSRKYRAHLRCEMKFFDLDWAISVPRKYSTMSKAFVWKFWKRCCFNLNIQASLIIICDITNINKQIDTQIWSSVSIEYKMSAFVSNSWITMMNLPNHAQGTISDYIKTSPIIIEDHWKIRWLLHIFCHPKNHSRAKHLENHIS